MIKKKNTTLHKPAHILDSVVNTLLQKKNTTLHKPAHILDSVVNTLLQKKKNHYGAISKALSEKFVKIINRHNYFDPLPLHILKQVAN